MPVSEEDRRAALAAIELTLIAVGENPRAAEWPEPLRALYDEAAATLGRWAGERRDPEIDAALKSLRQTVDLLVRVARMEVRQLDAMEDRLKEIEDILKSFVEFWLGDEDESRRS